MIAFDAWLTYAIAAFVIVILPGPTILLVVTQSIRHGGGAAAPLVLGVFLGDLIAMICSLAGLGLIVATSTFLFTAVKTLGALYLIYLGVTLWRSPISTIRTEPEVSEGGPSSSPWKLARGAFLVTVLNPKGIVFFIAFLPQFVDTRSDAMPQLLILGATFLVLAVLNAGGYALMAAKIGERFQQTDVRRRFNKAGAIALIFAGLMTALTSSGNG